VKVLLVVRSRLGKWMPCSKQNYEQQAASVITMHWPAWTWLEAKVPVRKGSRYTLNLAGNLVTMLQDGQKGNISSLYIISASLYMIFMSTSASIL